MIRLRTHLLLLALLLAVTSLPAAEHRLEKAEGAAPADAVSPQIASVLSATGISVFRGETRKVCDIWLCKEWQLKDLKPKGDVSYPFQPGQLIGVVRFARRSSDFRDQEIEAGVYTLRYGQQPVDGAHIGTSLTRDFLLLVSVKHDKAVAPLDYKKLVESSSEVAAESHPALLSLQRIRGEVATVPVIRNNAEKDWWSVRMQSKAKVGEELKNLTLELVVVGVASE